MDTSQKMNKTILETIKIRKAAGFNEMPPEVFQTMKFMTYFFDYSTLYINKNGWKARGINRTAKVYNALLLNHIQPQVRKFLAGGGGYEEIDP